MLARRNDEVAREPFFDHRRARVEALILGARSARRDVSYVGYSRPRRCGEVTGDGEPWSRSWVIRARGCFACL